MTLRALVRKNLMEFLFWRLDYRLSKRLVVFLLHHGLHSFAKDLLCLRIILLVFMQYNLLSPCIILLVLLLSGVHLLILLIILVRTHLLPPSQLHAL